MKHRATARAALVLGLAAVACASQAGTVPDQIFVDGFESGVSEVDAARFLDQATYGGRLVDIEQLKAIGYDAWFELQFTAPISLQLPYLQYVDNTQGVYQDARIEAWFIHSAQMTNPSDPGHAHADQLRQRLSFAWSQMMVVSERNATLGPQPYALADYHDTLARHAFGNYRELLEAVTLHPAMGKFLSMLGNRKTDVALNIRPDENYAREIMQLFSIGLVMLNPDGSVLDGDPVAPGVQPVPTYNQDVVRGFAHVFTGWNFDDCTIPEYDDCAPGNPYDGPWFTPMQPLEVFHDNTSSKQLLVYPGVALPGGVLAPGGDAGAELEIALDNIFHHPNVGPFVARHLIQRLITSNPTPAYIARVAAAFNDNGQGVRGDLRAVTRAVLLDPEARSGHLSTPETFGRLRDPITKLVRLFRVTDARSGNGRVFRYFHPDDEYAQRPLSAPSVFNFFKPNFAQPGEIRDAGLVSPEFQIHTDTQLVSAPNALQFRICCFFVGSRYSYAWENDAPVPEETLLDLGPLMALAPDPVALVNRLDLLMMSGGMSEYMRGLLVARLQGSPPDVVPYLPPATTPAQRLAHWRVQQALYLIITSPEFSVQK